MPPTEALLGFSRLVHAPLWGGSDSAPQTRQGGSVWISSTTRQRVALPATTQLALPGNRDLVPADVSGHCEDAHGLVHGAEPHEHRAPMRTSEPAPHARHQVDDGDEDRGAPSISGYPKSWCSCGEQRWAAWSRRGRGVAVRPAPPGERCAKARACAAKCLCRSGHRCRGWFSASPLGFSSCPLPGPRIRLAGGCSCLRVAVTATGPFAQPGSRPPRRRRRAGGRRAGR